MSSQSRLLAGVELGGTKCVCTLATSEGEVVAQERLPTTGPLDTLAAIRNVLANWSGRYAAIGIASFGPLDLDPSSPTYGHIVSTPKPGWSGTDLLSALDFGAPVLIDTDVNAAALAEGRWGSAMGLDSFAYITCGTGLGVGIVNRGQTIAGRGHCEMGHIRVPRLVGDTWPGCCPWHGDCVEGLSSGAAIRARHGPGEIADDWPGFASVSNALAMLIHNLFVTAQPRAILLGGGVMEGRPWLLEAVRAQATASLAAYYTAEKLADGEPFLRAPGLGSDAGPLGSIALALRYERQII